MVDPVPMSRGGRPAWTSTRAVGILLEVNARGPAATLTASAAVIRPRRGRPSAPIAARRSSAPRRRARSASSSRSSSSTSRGSPRQRTRRTPRTCATPSAVPRRRPRADRGLRRSRGEVHRGRCDGGVRGAGGAQRRRRASRARGSPGARGGRGVARAGLLARGACGGEHGRGDREREPTGRRRSARDRGRGEHGVTAAVGRTRRRPGRRAPRHVGRRGTQSRTRSFLRRREGQGRTDRDLARDERDLGAGRTAGDARPVRRPDARGRPDPLGVAPGDGRLEAAPGHRRRVAGHREVAAVREIAAEVGAGGGRFAPGTVSAVRGADRVPRRDPARAAGLRDLRLGLTAGRPRQARRGRRARSFRPRRARTRRATSGCCSGSERASRE